MIYLRRECHTLALKFGLCIDEAAFKKEMKCLEINDNEALKNRHSSATTHFIERQGQNEILAIVYLPPNSDCTLIQHYALLVHEGIHIWQRHIELIGENDPSHEYEAYSVQHISQELMLAFDKLVAKKKLKFAK